MQDGSSASSSIKLHLTANNEHASIHFIFHTHTHAYDDPNNTRNDPRLHRGYRCVRSYDTYRGRERKKKKLKNRVGERKGERERDR